MRTVEDYEDLRGLWRQSNTMVIVEDYGDLQRFGTVEDLGQPKTIRTAEEYKDSLRLQGQPKTLGTLGRLGTVEDYGDPQRLGTAGDYGDSRRPEASKNRGQRTWRRRIAAVRWACTWPGGRRGVGSRPSGALSDRCDATVLRTPWPPIEGLASPRLRSARPTTLRLGCHRPPSASTWPAMATAPFPRVQLPPPGRIAGPSAAAGGCSAALCSSSAGPAGRPSAPLRLISPRLAAPTVALY